MRRPEMRILLVEPINADQFPGQVNGMVRLFKSYPDHHGVRSSWLRFGAAADNQFRHGQDEVTLGAAELACLEPAIRRLMIITPGGSYPAEVSPFEAGCKTAARAACARSVSCAGLRPEYLDRCGGAEVTPL